jgi:hypothetical protein
MHMYDFTMFLRPFNIPYAPDTHRMLTPGYYFSFSQAKFRER